MRIGICGAGVAGPALAYWLQRTGHETTLIERSPHVRTGGYIIDFWGVGYRVAERMGLIEPIRQRGYQVKEVRLVNRNGRAVGGFSTDVIRRMTHDRFTSLARSELAAVIFDAVRDKAELRFGDTIAEMSDAGNEVVVRLESGATCSFDLLVGADGLHSQVRSLAFGEQERFERRLGYYVAAFESTNYPYRDDDIYVGYAEPGLSISRFSMREDRTLFLFVFAASHLDGPEPGDDAERKAALHAVYDTCAWETGDILDALDRAEEVYFDRASQIEVPHWSTGRVALIGDAAACPSLLAGEGTGLAITQAYVFAGELHRARGNIVGALQAYETRLRPFVLAKQKSARAFAPSFVPKSAFGIWLRHIVTRLMVIPPVAEFFMGNSVKDDFELPDYEI